MKNITAKHQQNVFRDAEGNVCGIGTKLNSHGDVEGMWYLDPQTKKKVWLDLEKMVHIKTFPESQARPKCSMWSYRDYSKQFRVTFNAIGNLVDKVFYALNGEDAKKKALVWASKNFGLKIGYLTKFVNTPGHAMKILEISSG